jgi:serine protease inhibitor
MAYYTYSNITREIVEISDFPLNPGDDCATTEVPITKQELESQYTWQKESLAFVLQPKRNITKLQYMNRFTDTELATIYTVAKTSIAVEIWLEKFKLASDINLDDPLVIGGLQALEQFGLIGTGRAMEILT